MSGSVETRQYGAFPTTHWTVVNALKTAPPAARHALLTEFLERYSPAFRLHLLHGRGITHEQDLEDALQGFITDKFVAKDILDYVNEGGGRLRDYFRRCLDHYVYSQHRSKTSEAWDQRISWDDLGRDPVDDGEPIGCFEVAWAQTVMTEAIIRTKDQFFHGQRPHCWDVFDLCIVRPLFTGQDPVPYAELAGRMGLSVTAVRNRKVTALRAFGKHLDEVIKEYVGDDAETIEQEIADLHQIIRSQCFQDMVGGQAAMDALG